MKELKNRPSLTETNSVVELLENTKFIQFEATRVELFEKASWRGIFRLGFDSIT